MQEQAEAGLCQDNKNIESEMKFNVFLKYMSVFNIFLFVYLLYIDCLRAIKGCCRLPVHPSAVNTP